MKLNSILLICLALLSAILSGCEQEKKEINNVKLASFYLEQGNDKLALQMLAEELKKNANQVDAHRLLGTIFINAEIYQQAVTHFKTAIELGCGQTCTGGLIDAYIGQGEIDLARQEYKDHIEDKESNLSRYRAELIDFHTHKNHQQTIDRLKTIDLPAARDRILILKFAQGRYKEIDASYKPETDYSEDQLLVFAQTSYLLKQYENAEDILLKLNLKRSSRLLTRKKIQAVDLQVKTNLALDKISDAEMIYHNFLKNNEGTSFVTFQNAITQLTNRNYDAAIDEIADLASNNPGNPKFAQVLAIAQFGKQNYRAVINGLEPFEASLNEKSRILLADAYSKSGNPDKAIKLLQGITDNQAKLILSRSHLQMRDKKQALSIVESMAPEKGNQQFNLGLAELWFDLGEFDKLIAGFSGDNEHALKIKYLVANSYLKLDKPDAARKYARDESDAELSLEIRGYIEAVSGNLDAATKIYRELVKSNPAKKSYFLLASSHLENKEYDETLKAVKTGAELEGDNRALLILANRMLIEDNHEGTYGWLDSLADTHPDYRVIQYQLANYEVSRNLNDKAMQRLQPMMKDADSQVLYLMAMASRTHDSKESLRLLEQSLEKGFSLKVASMLHQYYEKNGDRDNLRRINARIEQEAGVNAGSANLLAKGYLALEQYDKSDKLAETLKEQGFAGSGQELIGDGLARRGKHQEAAKIYAELLDANAKESLLVKYYSSTVEAGENLETVLGKAESRLEGNREMYVLRNFIAIKYIGIDNKAAIRHFEILTEKFPEDSVLLNNLAWANLDVNPAAALRHSEKAYQAHTDNFSILDTYVRALVKNNRSSAAKQLLQGKLDQNPDNNELQNMMKSLN